MTLMEAIKSKRRFKRGPSGAWMTPKDSFTVEQMLDEGWELEGVRVTITRETLAAAWDKAFDVQDEDEGAWDRLCGELGL